MCKVSKLLEVHTRERGLGKMSSHHRVCRSHKKGIKDNTVRISKLAHESYHKLFHDAYPWEVAKVLNALFIDPQFKLICVKRGGEKCS